MPSEPIDGDAFKVVASGQVFTPSARRENLLSEMAKGYQARRGGAPSDAGVSRNQMLGGAVEITNNSGAQIDAGGVLGISGVAISQADNPSLFQQRIMLTGVTPTSADHTGLFAVAAEPIGAGRIGRCFISGAFPAQVNIVSISDQFCDVKDGDATQLESGPTGAARILYAPASSGTQWCIIRMGDAPGTPRGIITGASLLCYGTYVGNLLKPPGFDTPAGSTLTVTDFGVAGESIIIINAKEIGQETHDLVDPENIYDRVCLLAYVGTNEDGTMVYMTDKLFFGCEGEDSDIDGGTA